MGFSKSIGPLNLITMTENPEPKHNETHVGHLSGQATGTDSNHHQHTDLHMDQEELLKMLLRNEIEEGM